MELKEIFEETLGTGAAAILKSVRSAVAKFGADKSAAVMARTCFKGISALLTPRRNVSQEHLEAAASAVCEAIGERLDSIKTAVVSFKEASVQLERDRADGRLDDEGLKAKREEGEELLRQEWAALAALMTGVDAT